MNWYDKKDMIMDKRNQDIAYFLSFCIEQYKNEKGISGEAAMKMLAQNGALEYLSENYEVLHTQGSQWLLEEIDEFINTKRKEATV